MYAHERLLSRTMNFLTIKSKRKEISTPLFNLFVTNHDYVKSCCLHDIQSKTRKWVFCFYQHPSIQPYII